MLFNFLLSWHFGLCRCFLLFFGLNFFLLLLFVLLLERFLVIFLSIEIQVFFLKLFHDFVHEFFIFFNFVLFLFSEIGQFSFHLILQFFAELARRLKLNNFYIDKEMVKSSSHRALVSKIPRDLALVFAICSSDEGSIEE